MCWISEEATSHLPKGVVGHVVRAENGQEFGLHAARYQIVIALVAAWFLETCCLAQTEHLFEHFWGNVGYPPLAGLAC